MAKWLITGGSGFLGRELARRLKRVDRVVIYSRNEAKQAEMAQELPEGGNRGIRYMVGDIRDLDRLKRAMDGVDYVVHAAAMKRIDTCAYNVIDCVENNINGTMNVAKACVDCGVKKAVLVSTDKAPQNCSVYGASKYMGEHIFSNFNNYGSTVFNSLRYGNVAGSTQSCFVIWDGQRSRGSQITLTDPDATRFFWGIGDAATFVISAFSHNVRGCILIPKMKSYRMKELARCFGDKIDVIGNRTTEKKHEILVSELELNRTVETDYGFCVYPERNSWSEQVIVESGIGGVISSENCTGDAKQLIRSLYGEGYC